MIGIIGGDHDARAPRCMALVQDDIKRVLAYSTLSQLAYMIAGDVARARRVATRRSSTCSRTRSSRRCCSWGPGRVIHAVHSNNMSDMGGLRKTMPITFWTFLIGSLGAGRHRPARRDSGRRTSSWSPPPTGHELLFAIMLLTAVLTAFYTMRMVVLTFFGAYEGHGHPHESPPSAWPARSSSWRSARRSSDSSARRSSTRRSSSGSSSRNRGGALRGVDRAPVGTAAALLGIARRRGALLAAGRDRSRSRTARSGLEPAGAPVLHRRLLHEGHRLPGARHACRRASTGSTRTCSTPS